MENKPTTFSSESERLRNPPPEPTELAKRIEAYETRLAEVERKIRDMESKWPKTVSIS